MHNDILRVLLSEEEIQVRIREMAKEIEETYAGEEILAVCILKGSVVFYGDLCKYINVPMRMDFMSVSSYGNSIQTSGNVKIKQDLNESVEGRHVLLVEDIIDSGLTLSNLKKLMMDRGAASCKIVTLLDKPEGRKPGVTLKGDYTGFEIPNEFVVGCGLDYAEKYRNLPYVGVLKPEVYSK